MKNPPYMQEAPDSAVEECLKEKSFRNNIIEEARYGERDFLASIYDINTETSERVCFRGVDSEVQSPADPYHGDLYREIYLSLYKVYNTIHPDIKREGLYDPGYECYSKYLVAPLFRYSNQNFGLSIRKLRMNTYLLRVKVRASYIDSDSNTRIDFEPEPVQGVEVPMKKIACEGAILKEVRSFFKECYGEKVFPGLEVEELLDFWVEGITLDVSVEKFKERLGDYLLFDPRHMGEKEYREKYDPLGPINPEVLRRAALRKNHVVISNIDQRDTMKDGRKMETRNPIVLQLIRFMYLMHITESAPEFGTVVKELLDGKYPQWLEPDKNDAEIIEWISRYLDENWEAEQREYFQYFEAEGLFDKENPKKKEERQDYLFDKEKGKAEVQELLDRLAAKGGLAPGNGPFPDQKFFLWMREKAGLITT